jgi:5,10-methylenetetrahydrofolate reductase
MLDEGRAYAESLDAARPLRFGAATRLQALPSWKRSVDFLFVQIGFSLDDLLEWRSGVRLDGVPVYAGVIVLPSAGMARRLASSIPSLEIPPNLVARLELDRDAGIGAACDLIARIRDSGAIEGVHLIPTSRYREVAARLEKML